VEEEYITFRFKGGCLII